MLGITIAPSVAWVGTAAAHGSGTYSGGMMGGGWGLFGGTMDLWGFLWMGLLIGLPLLLGYSMLARRSQPTSDRPLAILREQYARGDLSDEEFDRRRRRLDELQ